MAENGPGPRPRRALLEIEPYVPGRSIESVRAERGLAEVIKLASNENPLGPSPLAVAAMREAAAAVHRYPDGSATVLRQRLAQHLSVPAEGIVVGNGSDEIVRLLAEAFLEPGDEAVMAACTFSQYAAATRLMGGIPRTVPLQDEVHDLERMAAACTDRTRIVFVCNPNNPTGTIVERERVAAFLESLPPDVLVVFDEAYREYVRAETYPDTLEWIRAKRPLVVLRTFSKVYGLAGLRIGYGIMPRAVARALERARGPFNVNLMAQRAALAALEDQEHVKKSVAANAAGVDLLSAELTRLGFGVTPTQANFLWVDAGDASGSIAAALLERGIIVRSGAAFGRPTHLRISVGTDTENRRLLEALAEIRGLGPVLGERGGMV
ncbi:MAG TPA: histidinol-phosphate transaminase [Limnochordia bacterium]